MDAYGDAAINYNALPMLEDIISELPEKQRTIMQAYLSCGTVTGVTRLTPFKAAEVAETLNRTMLLMPTCYEDKYRYWVSYYELTYERMVKIWDISKATWYYLQYTCTPGEAPWQSMETDPNADECVQNYFRNTKYIVVDNNTILREKWTIIREIMESRHVNVPCSAQTLFEEYLEICRENNLPDATLSVEHDLHAFKGYAVEQLWLVCTYGQNIRFYDIEEHHVAELIRQIPFDKYMDMEISANKIFNDNPNLMIEYELQSGYELHNVLKKASWALPDYVSVLRMPHISIGNANRYIQTENLLLSVMPIDEDAFCQLLAETYGLDIGTAKTPEWRGHLRKYLYKRRYEAQYAQSEYSNDMLNTLRGVLTNGAYTIDEAMQICQNAFPALQLPDVISILHILNFTVRNEYALSSNYSSLRDYIEKEITSPDGTIDLRHPTSNVALHAGVYNTIIEKCRNKTLFETAHRIYIPAYALPQEMIPHIDSFVHDITAFVSSKKPVAFNTQWAVSNGFIHPILTYNMSMWFYDSLIKHFCHDYASMMRCNVQLFGDSTYMSVIDIVTPEVQSGKIKSLSDCEQYLQNTYGLALGNTLKTQFTSLSLPQFSAVDIDEEFELM